MLKNIMQKCMVVNYVDKETWSGNTDLIEKKLENCTRQIAQDLYSGEAQHEPRGAQHCRSLHETFGWVENAVARKGNVYIESWMVRKVTIESL